MTQDELVIWLGDGFRPLGPFQADYIGYANWFSSLLKQDNETIAYVIPPGERGKKVVALLMAAPDLLAIAELMQLHVQTMGPTELGGPNWEMLDEMLGAAIAKARGGEGRSV